MLLLTGALGFLVVPAVLLVLAGQQLRFARAPLTRLAALVACLDLILQALA